MLPDWAPVVRLLPQFNRVSGVCLQTNWSFLWMRHVGGNCGEEEGITEKHPLCVGIVLFDLLCPLLLLLLQCSYSAEICLQVGWTEDFYENLAGFFSYYVFTMGGMYLECVCGNTVLKNYASLKYKMKIYFFPYSFLHWADSFSFSMSNVY